MQKEKLFIYFFLRIYIILLLITTYDVHCQAINKFFDYYVNPKISNIEFFWKKENGELYENFINLDASLKIKGKHLCYAINGGIYDTDYEPCGLYIENGKELKKINLKDGEGNFYLKPNGIFYITNFNLAKICETSEFKINDSVKYAIQSGPLLIHNGKICNSFQSYTKKYVRNAVGILPNGEIVFTISKYFTKNEITLTELSQHLYELGCTNALYLDGFISDYYINDNNYINKNHFFITIIGVIE